jgi:hypothetical protein
MLKKIGESPEELVPSIVTPKKSPGKYTPQAYFFGLKLASSRQFFIHVPYRLFLHPFNLFAPVIVYNIQFLF